MLPTVCTLLGLLVGATPAPAAGPRGLVLLVDASPALTGPLRAPLTEGLRGEIERSVDFRWVDPPAISLDELTIALNCNGMDDVCIRKAGAAIKADTALLVTPAPAPRKELLFMLVQLNPPRPTRMAAVPLQDVALVVQDARKAVRSLLGPARPARLVVLTQPGGATVQVDGQPQGLAPATLQDLPPGNHKVAVALHGFQPQSVDVLVALGESKEVNLTLVPTPVAAAPVAAAPAPAGTPAAAGEAKAGRSPLFFVARALLGGGVGVMLTSLVALVAGVLVMPAGPVSLVGIAAGTQVAKDPMMAAGLNMHLAVDILWPYLTPVALVAGGGLAFLALLAGAAGAASLAGGAVGMAVE